MSRSVSSRKSLRRGDYLFRQGDRFRGLLAVKAGTAKLITSDAQGNEHVIGFLLPGELMGFDALADDYHRCTAVALETMSFCELPASRLNELCQEVPSLLRELFRHASTKLSEETDQLILVKRPAEARVAAFLLDVSSRLQRRGFSPHEFRLSLTRQEIGNYLGLALETVSRTLRQFEDRGVILIKNRQVKIQQMDALRAISNA